MLNETTTTLINYTQPALNFTLNTSNLQPPAAVTDWVTRTLAPALTGYGLTLNLVILLLYASSLLLGRAKYLGELRELTKYALIIGIIGAVLNNFYAIPHSILYLLLAIGFLGEISLLGIPVAIIFFILALA